MGLTGLRRGERGCCAADGAYARRTGLLHGERAAAQRAGLLRLRGGRGCCAASGAAVRLTGLLRLRGGRGCCAADGAAARRTGLLRGGWGRRGCCGAIGAAARRPGLLHGERGCGAADRAAARRSGTGLAAGGGRGRACRSGTNLRRDRARGSSDSSTIRTGGQVLAGAIVSLRAGAGRTAATKERWAAGCSPVARRTGLLHGERGCPAASGAYARRTGLLCGGGGCCAAVRAPAPDHKSIFQFPPKVRSDPQLYPLPYPLRPCG
jgi:hypothetical protein